MAYGDFKDWARKTATDKILRDKASNIAKILKLAEELHKAIIRIVYSGQYLGCN